MGEFVVTEDNVGFLVALEVVLCGELLVASLDKFFAFLSGILLLWEGVLD